MKTLKVVLVAALVLGTAMGFAQNPFRTRPNFESKIISVTNVLSASELGIALRTQIDPMIFLGGEDMTGMYIATVKVKAGLIKVCGTYNQWCDFFNRKLRETPFENFNNSMREIK